MSETKQGVFGFAVKRYYAIVLTDNKHAHANLCGPARREGWVIWNGVVVSTDEITEHCRIVLRTASASKYDIKEISHEEAFDYRMHSDRFGMLTKMNRGVF